MPRGTYGNGPLDSYTDFSTYERCITRGIAGSTLRVVYGNGQRIVQAPGVVAISYEMIHDTRLIYTDGRPHINQAIRQYLGDSRAHWEGDELVVETTNLTDRTAIGLNGNGNRHSTQMKLTERFKRVADDILQYQITVDDPVTYVRPFTMSYPLTPLDGGKLLPYDCHEGNYALASVARGRARRGPCAGGRQIEGNHSTAAARAGRTGRRRSASGRRRRNTGPVAEQLLVQRLAQRVLGAFAAHAALAGRLDNRSCQRAKRQRKRTRQSQPKPLPDLPGCEAMIRVSHPVLA